MKFLSKIYISPLCIVFVLFGIIFNKLEEILFLFCLCFVHEIGHILVAIIFSCSIKQVSVNIFGFSADIEGVEYLSCIKQIIIFLAGPLTYFISWIILFLLAKSEFINQYQYEVYMQNNLALCLFNLIPLYPLDGGRIVDCINKYYFPVRYSFTFRRIWVIICSLCVCTLLVLEKQFIMLFMIMSFVCFNLIFNRYEYMNYLQDRMNREIYFKNKISFEGELFHFYNNYYFIDNNLVDEKTVIPIFILKENLYRKSRY